MQALKIDINQSLGLSSARLSTGLRTISVGNSATLALLRAIKSPAGGGAGRYSGRSVSEAQEGTAHSFVRRAPDRQDLVEQTWFLLNCAFVAEFACFQTRLRLHCVCDGACRHRQWRRDHNLPFHFVFYVALQYRDVEMTNPISVSHTSHAIYEYHCVLAGQTGPYADAAYAYS